MKRSVKGFRLAAAALALGIFLVDTFTPLEGAVAVLYVVVILLAAATGRRRDIISGGVASFLLTVAAYIYSHGAAHVGDPTIRAGVSLAAIGITTLLALRNQRTTTQLAAEERRFRRMFDASRMGIVLEEWSAVRTELAKLGPLDASAMRARIAKDPDLVSRARRLAKVLDTNPAFLKMIGTSGSLRRPETMDDVLGAMDRTFPDALAAFAEGQPYHEGESQVIGVDGRVIPVLIAVTFPAPDDIDGTVLVFIADNTDRQRAQDAMLAAQAELAHAARVATLGDLTASIAHEVNQPLMAVATSGEAGMRWLRREKPDLNEVESALTRITSEAHRAGAIVSRIRTFLSKSQGPRAPLSLEAVIHEATALVDRQLAQADVDLVLDIEPGLPQVTGDRVQLQQVLVNLLLNAAQAMAGRDPPRQLVVTAQRVDQHVEITVYDTGPGIAEPDIERLFEPFFTTKPNGMGMGLAICRTTVESHGGQLTVESRLGQGASFRITLPSVPS